MFNRGTFCKGVGRVQRHPRRSCAPCHQHNPHPAQGDGDAGKQTASPQLLLSSSSLTPLPDINGGTPLAKPKAPCRPNPKKARGQGAHAGWPRRVREVKRRDAAHRALGDFLIIFTGDSCVHREGRPTSPSTLNFPGKAPHLTTRILRALPSQQRYFSPSLLPFLCLRVSFQSQSLPPQLQTLTSHLSLLHYTEQFTEHPALWSKGSSTPDFPTVQCPR